MLYNVSVRVCYGNRILIDLLRTACTKRSVAILIANAFAQAGLALARTYLVTPENSPLSGAPVSVQFYVVPFRIV